MGWTVLLDASERNLSAIRGQIIAVTDVLILLERFADSRQ
jgi:hypothetical protein